MTVDLAYAEPEPGERIDLGPKRRLNPLTLYPKIGWKPHVGQRKVIRSRARNKVVSGGRRLGKSEIGGHDLVTEALNTRMVRSRLEEMKKRREFWIVGPSYTDSEKEFRVLWNRLDKMGLKEYFDKPGSYNDPVGGSMHLSMWGGTFQVHAKSEKHPDSLVGEGLSGVVLAEAAKMKERTWTKLIRPTLADFAGWSLMTSTPEGKNWFYDMWKAGQDPSRPDWASWRLPSWTNPYVYPMGATELAIKAVRSALEMGGMASAELFEILGVDPEIGALITDLTSEAFNQEIAADFTEFVGRVFKTFDEEKHVGDFDFNPSWATYACVDYGFTNPNVWLLLQVDPHGERVVVLNEVYERGLTTEEFAKEIISRGLCPADTRFFYPDPADPGSTRIMEKHLQVKHRGGTGGEIKWRVDTIRAALKDRNPHLPEDHIDRMPALMFDRKCKNTISDFLNYRYPEKKTELEARSNEKENPMKKDDHGPEALGRFYAGHFGTLEKVARRARVSKARVG